MIIRVKGYITSKSMKPNCMDSLAANIKCKRFAVADGVTHSVHSEIVSKLLCKYFVNSNISINDWKDQFESNMLPAISNEWIAKEQEIFSHLSDINKELAQFRRKYVKPGASNIAGIEIDPVNKKVDYLILGDSTLFYINNEGSYFSVNSGQESHERGRLLTYNSITNNIMVSGLGQPQRINGEWLTGSFNIESGYILLMTDGCAEWFQGAYAKDPNVLDNLWNLSDNDDFSKLAEQERTLNGKMDDDLAVIMLKIDTDIFQMEYFPTGQSQAMLIDKTGSVVTDNVDNNNVNLENDDNENNEEKEIEVTTEVKESEEDKELKNEDKKDAEGEESVKENNIDERENNDIDNIESINHNGSEIPQEPEDNTNTITNNSESESIETNEDKTIQDKGTGETSCLNETVVEISPQDDDLIAKEEQNSTNVISRHISDKQTIMCPFCGKIHYENSKYCPDTGKLMLMAERWINETKVSDKVTQVLPKIICKVCGTHYDTDTCPNCGQPHPASVKKNPLTLSASVPIQAVLTKDADEKREDVNKSDGKVEKEIHTTLKDIPSVTTPETSMIPENSAKNQTKVNIGNIIQNQEKMVEEGVISDSINDNLENAQIDINASDEDDHLPPSDLRDEQIVDVNTNIEAEDDLTKIDSSVPVIQKGSDTNLVEEANSKDETSQTPTEDYLEEIDVDASESLPETSLTGNPVGDNDNSHNINKS